MKLILPLFVFFFCSLKVFSNEINLKAITGKVMVYRDGVHFQYDGKKMLKENDVLQTFGKAGITVEYRNFLVTLGPNTFFELKPGQTRTFIQIGNLIYGNIFTELSLVQTDKPYKIMSTNAEAMLEKSQLIYTVARNKREVLLMQQGKESGAPDNLDDARAFQTNANTATKIIMIDGKGKLTLKNKTEKNLFAGNSLEFKAEGIALKEEEVKDAQINEFLTSIGFNLPAFKRK